MILRPRVVLKSNSQCGSEDLHVQKARSSWESQQDAESHGETRSNTCDHRVLGILISTVKLQDALTSYVLHCSESDECSEWHAGNSYATCHNQESRHTRILGNAFTYSISVQFEARSRERTAILPHKVICGRSL